jgi:biopolymer transport protein ExbB/TolQ
MFDLINRGGDLMYILVLFAIIIIGLTVKKAIDLFSKKDLPQTQLESGINAIIFWGSLSLLIGFFSHFTGLYLAMQAIAKASDISPAVVASGYGISLISILAGMLIFIISIIVWFFFRWRVKKLISNIE